MKSLLTIVLFTILSYTGFAQDLAAAQQRADERLNALKTSLSLTESQIPLVKTVIDNTEKDCENISASRQTTEAKNTEISSRRNTETESLRGILSPEQMAIYEMADLPAPSKANINTSRSSIKKSQEN